MRAFNKDNELSKNHNAFFLVAAFSFAFLVTIALYNSYAIYTYSEEEIMIVNSIVGEFDHVLMARNDTDNLNDGLWENSSKFTTVEFLKESNTLQLSETVIDIYNASDNYYGNVWAWTVDDGSGNDTYKLYIQAYEKLKLNSDSSNLFSSMSNLTSILGLENVDTSNVLIMNNMFKDCILLESVDLSLFKDAKVTELQGLFYNCNLLSNINFVDFDTSNVFTMKEMFYDCKALTEIDFSNFNTSNVTDMSYMFNGCTALTDVDLSSFKTTSLTNMSSMFKATALKTLDLSMFDTSEVTNMQGLFNMSGSLSQVDLSSFVTTNVLTMNSMFQNCRSLSALDLSHFDTSNVTNMGYMFNNCTGLRSLNLAGWDTSKVANMIYMFVWCNMLSELDISHFDTSSLTEMGYMFFEVQVKNIDVSKWNLSKVVNFSNAFAYTRNATFVINVNSTNIKWFADMFKSAAINTGAEIIVNYTAQNESKVKEMIATKSETSNVVLGSLIEEQ